MCNLGAIALDVKGCTQMMANARWTPSAEPCATVSQETQGERRRLQQGTPLATVEATALAAFNTFLDDCRNSDAPGPNCLNLIDESGAIVPTVFQVNADGSVCIRGCTEDVETCPCTSTGVTVPRTVTVDDVLMTIVDNGYGRTGDGANGVRATVSQLCEAGTAQRDIGGGGSLYRNCILCPPGTANGRPGATSCSTCAAGSYAEGYKNPVCTKCAAGTALAGTGSSDASDCEVCPIDTFSGEGAAACTRCDAFTSTNGLTGQTT